MGCCQFKYFVEAKNKQSNFKHSLILLKVFVKTLVTQFFLQINIPQEADIYNISYDIEENGNLVITAPQANGEHFIILAFIDYYS